MKIIELRNFSFTYSVGTSDSFHMHDVNLRIQHGQRIGILGPNGSNKSTIIQLLLKILQAKPGMIFYDEQDIIKFPRNNLLACLLMSRK